MWQQFLNNVPILLGVVFGGIATIHFAYRKGFRTGLTFAWDVEAKEPTILVGDVIQAIMDANPDRESNNLHRRIIKIMEEVGETSEAYLNVTSAHNGKKKRWADVREELADVVIVAVDCALTPTPDQIGLTRKQVAEEFADEISRKLTKRRKNRDTGKESTGL